MGYGILQNGRSARPQINELYRIGLETLPGRPNENEWGQPWLQRQLTTVKETNAGIPLFYISRADPRSLVLLAQKRVGLLSNFTGCRSSNDHLRTRCRLPLPDRERKMNNVQMAILTVTVFAWTLVGCGLDECSKVRPGDRYGKNDGGGQNTGIPWCVEKDFEWVWDLNPGGKRSYTLTVRVIEVDKLVKLAMSVEEDGKVSSKDIVYVHASAVPAAMVNMAYDSGETSKGQLDWAPSSRQLGEIYRAAAGRQERQGGGRVQAYTATWRDEGFYIVVGGAIPPDIIMLGNPSTAMLSTQIKLLARPKP